jgi:hypothetical protein
MASGLDSSDTSLLASACVSPTLLCNSETVTRRPQLRNDRTSRMNFGQSSRAGMPDKRPNSSELGDVHRQTTATATTQPRQHQSQTNNVSEGNDYTNSMAVKVIDISSKDTPRAQLHAVMLRRRCPIRPEALPRPISGIAHDLKSVPTTLRKTLRL